MTTSADRPHITGRPTSDQAGLTRESSDQAPSSEWTAWLIAPAPAHRRAAPPRRRPAPTPSRPVRLGRGVDRVGPAALRSHGGGHVSLGQVSDDVAGVDLHAGQGLRPDGVEEEQTDEVEPW